MRTVYKYPLFEMTPGLVNDVRSISMPDQALVVGAGMQGRMLCIWAYVDSHLPVVTRTFTVRGTGHVVSEYTDAAPGIFWPRYVSIVFDGQFVWHVFEST